MQKVELEVKPRDLGQKDVTRNLTELRGEGWIPGTLYGNGEVVKIAVDHKVFTKAIRTTAGVNALFTVKFGSESSLAVIKEIQRHVIKHNPIHVDLMRIDTKAKLSVSVPTRMVGEAPGVKKAGGILEHITREVRVRCLPDDIPAAIDVDVTQLGLGHGVKVKDLPALKGVEYLTAADTIIVNIVAPKIEEEKPAPGTEAAAAAGAQPEVIAKGKKEEEGAAAPAAAGAKPAAGAPAKAAPASKDDKKK